MQVKFNPDLSIDDFEDGKIIVEVETLESYYLEQGVFELLAPALEQFVEVRDLFPASYAEEEYEPFINDLVESRVLIKK